MTNTMNLRPASRVRPFSAPAPRHALPAGRHASERVLSDPEMTLLWALLASAREFGAAGGRHRA